jgi:hypothetical protein
MVVKRKTPKFKSKFEARIYGEATERGDALEYEPADLKLPYVIQSVYLPDFRLPNGIIVETKGAFMYEDRRKMLLVKQAHPELDIRMVFQRSENPLRKGAKMTYAGWAEANGFQWAEGKIPEEWFKEKK